jgi:ketosteroid isomerase-like protein
MDTRAGRPRRAPTPPIDADRVEMPTHATGVDDAIAARRRRRVTTLAPADIAIPIALHSRTMSATPEVITSYLQAADAGDFDALVACFAEDGTVLDEGNTYVGRDAIRRWREDTASKWTYTTTVTGTEQLAGDRFDVAIHLKGNFPGGEADLTQAFTLSGGLIGRLTIG